MTVQWVQFHARVRCGGSNCVIACDVYRTTGYAVVSCFSRGKVCVQKTWLENLGDERSHSHAGALGAQPV